MSIPALGTFQERVETILGALERADETKSHGAMLIAIGSLVEIVKDQQQEIGILKRKVECLSDEVDQNLQYAERHIATLTAR